MRRAAAIALALTAAAPAAAQPSPSLAIAPDGAVYFSDLQHVWRLGPDGDETIAARDLVAIRLSPANVMVSTSFKQGPAEPATARDGVYGVSSVYYSGRDAYEWFYWTLADDTGHGAVTPRTGEGADAALRKLYPVDEEGRAYVPVFARGRAEIVRVDASGARTSLAGGAPGHADGAGPAARFGRFGDIALGPDGALYVTSNGFLRRVSLDGEVTTVLGEDEGFSPSVDERGRLRYSDLAGLDVAADGTVFVCDLNWGRVFKRTPDGAVVTVFESEPDYHPLGVELAGGDLYVLEAPVTLHSDGGDAYTTWRVWRGGADGRFTRLDRDQPGGAG